ncbi:DarT ssDNA thymidine ADP-ribosyltransferase family protein [Moritella dasanensis]|uniref:DarT ssDNA thymidine ADP-ribosyltransferase family protein n=1 Tax=Moritella dasanensis TaxID=428031 RepID=UPI0002EF3C8F|nr:DarT ssDNA thymidine ADP-ribosyltransferase family protein [Moritella dasanensis]
MSFWKSILYFIGFAFDDNGYNKFGFNRDGEDVDGYDKNGFKGFNIHYRWNRDGINQTTGIKFDQWGKDEDGYDKDGYESNGFDRNGIHKVTGTKYKEDGYDKDGYDRNNWYWNAIHRLTGTQLDPDGFNKDGYSGCLPQYTQGSDVKAHTKAWRDAFDNGFDRAGFNRDAWNKDGVNRETGTKYDVRGEKWGYDEDGWNTNGWDRNAIHKKTDCRFDDEGYRKDGSRNLAVVCKQNLGQDEYNLAVKYLHFEHNSSSGELSRLAMTAAELGHAQAQYLLGLLFEGGKYFPKDHPIKNTRRFPPQPITIPKYFEPSLSSLFMMESGIPPNHEEAMKWYYSAAKQGHDTAKLRLDYLRDKRDPICLEALEADLLNSSVLDKLNINYIYHMTHIDNIESILKQGLLSHKNAPVLHDISDPDVNSRRIKTEPIYNRSIHSYVPFYFNPRNAMLYSRKHIQDSIVILAVDRSLIYAKSSLTTDGNAASSNTGFSNKSDDLNVLSWECINSKYWNDFFDGKRKSMSEVLVYSSVEPSSILKFICKNPSTQNVVSKLLAVENINTPVVVNKSFYFDTSDTVGVIQ